MNCPKCIIVRHSSMPGVTHTSITFKQGYCDFCKGKRYLDWVEDIIGVDEYIPQNGVPWMKPLNV